MSSYGVIRDVQSLCLNLFCYFLYGMIKAILLQYLRTHFGQLEAHSGFCRFFVPFCFVLVMFQAMLVQYLRTHFELYRSHTGCPVDAFKPFLLLHIWDDSSYASAIFTGSFRAIRGSFRFLSIFCNFLFR